MENGWMVGKLPRLTLGVSIFVSLLMEGCCCRGCCTSWWSMLCCVGPFFFFFFSLTTSLQWSFNDVINCLEAVIENWWNFFFLRLEFHTLCITRPTDLSDKILGSNFRIRLIFYYKKNNSLEVLNDWITGGEQVMTWFIWCLTWKLLETDLISAIKSSQGNYM